MKIIKILSIVTIFIILFSILVGCNNKQSDSENSAITSAHIEEDSNKKSTNKNDEWLLKKINEPIVDSVKIESITIDNSKSIDMASTIIKNYNCNELRAIISKEKILQNNYTLANYHSENTYSGTHYIDAPNYLYATTSTEVGILGCSNTNADKSDYNDFSIILKNQYLAYYSTPNIVEYKINNTSEKNIGELQSAAYAILSEIVNKNYAEYLIYNGDNINFNNTLRASDGSEYEFVREITETDIILRLTITPNIKSRSGIYAYYIPKDFVSLSQNLKYKLSNIVETNNLYDFDFKSDNFLKDYRLTCGIAYGDEQKTTIYPDKINISTIESDNGFIQNQTYINHTSPLSSNISIDYNVIENDGKVSECNLKISGISGNISDTADKLESYKKLNAESKKCINYFFPTIDLTSVISQENNNYENITTEYDKTILGINGKLECRIEAKQSAIDTWVGTYALSFEAKNTKN